MGLTVAPLAIVQARLGSTRLPRKMLLPLGGHPLIWWAWHAAVEAFGDANVVIALPANAENDELTAMCEGFGATVFRCDGPEEDVLIRVWFCAHRYRWHPDSVIVRITPDGPFKDPRAIRAVAGGARLPVEIAGEAFTLAMLDAAKLHAPWASLEHLTWLVFPTPPPSAPARQVWSIDTPEDYEAAKRRMEAE